MPVSGALQSTSQDVKTVARGQQTHRNIWHEMPVLFNKIHFLRIQSHFVVPVHHIYCSSVVSTHFDQATVPIWSHSAPPSIILLHSADNLPKSEASTEGEIMARGIYDEVEIKMQEHMLSTMY